MLFINSAANLTYKVFSATVFRHLSITWSKSTLFVSFKHPQHVLRSSRKPLTIYNNIQSHIHHAGFQQNFVGAFQEFGRINTVTVYWLWNLRMVPVWKNSVFQGLALLASMSHTMARTIPIQLCDRHQEPPSQLCKHSSLCASMNHVVSHWLLLLLAQTMTHKTLNAAKLEMWAL